MRNIFSEKEKLLANECSLTVSMLDSGFHALSEANMTNKGLYYQALFSLSIGIERLLKIILITKYRNENNGVFPEDNKIRRYGHKIEELLGEINLIYNDEIDKEIVKLLNDFANQSRYYNMDIMSRGQASSENPLRSWDSILKLIIKQYKDKLFVFKENKVLNELNKKTVVLIHDLNGELIEEYSDLIVKDLSLQQVQIYAIKHIFVIVSKMVDYLLSIRDESYFLPDLLDFFGKYNVDVLDQIDIEEIEWLSPHWI